MLDNPKLKLWKASAVVTVYVLAETAEDVTVEFDDFARDEIQDNGCGQASITEVALTPEGKAKIPAAWLDTLPYMISESRDDEGPTVGKFIDEAIAAEAERVKRGPLPGQLSLGLEGES